MPSYFTMAFLVSLALAGLAALGRMYLLPRLKNARARRALIDLGLYGAAIVRRVVAGLPAGMTVQTAPAAILASLVPVAVGEYQKLCPHLIADLAGVHTPLQIELLLETAVERELGIDAVGTLPVAPPGSGGAGGGGSLRAPGERPSIDVPAASVGQILPPPLPGVRAQRQASAPHGRRAGFAPAMLSAAALLMALVAGCTTAPASVDGGPSVTPTGWVSTAEGVDTVLSVALPAMEAALPLLHLAPVVAAHVTEALAAVDHVALPRFNAAILTYQREATTANLCGQNGARAATDSLVLALEGVADTLGSLGWGMAAGVDLALSGLGGILDETYPACPLDPTVDAGMHVGAHLGAGAAIRDHLDARPAGLRPFPVVGLGVSR